MSKFSDATFYLSPSGYKEGFIFPQKPLSTNGDVSFVRAGSAWRTTIDGQIEESPYNLLSYSEDFTTVWQASGDITVSGNTKISPNGTLSASTLNVTNTAHFFRQVVNVIPSTTYTFSFYALRGTMSGMSYSIYNTTSGALGNIVSPTSYYSQTNSLTWSRITLTFTTPAVCSSIGAYLLRDSNATGTSFFWGAQVVIGGLPKNYLYTTNRQNFPRVDYSLGTGNLLLEPQRTNLLLNSVLSGGGSTPTSWALAASTGTNTAVDSLKNKNCTAYNFVVNSQRQILTQYVAVTSGVSYSFSVYIESVNTINTIQEFIVCAVLAGTSTYYKNNVGISGADIATSNAVYTIVYVPSSTGSVELRIGAGCSSNQTANVTLSMPQFEQGAFGTTFIPTSNASATRLVDTFSRNNLYTNNLISISGGTWLIDTRNNIPYIRDAFSQSVSIGNSPNLVGSNGFALTFGSSIPTRFQIRKYVGGVETTPYSTSTDTVKLIIKWNGSTADFFINGIKQISATAFTGTTMSHLFGNALSTPVFIQQTALWNTPLTDAQCIELTS
jgi:hypothetical protein